MSTPLVDTQEYKFSSGIVAKIIWKLNLPNLKIRRVSSLKAVRLVPDEISILNLRICEYPILYKIFWIIKYSHTVWYYREKSNEIERNIREK